VDGGWDVSSQGVLVSRAWEVWRRDVSTPEVIERVDGGWDVWSRKKFWVARGGHGDETSPPREGGFDRGRAWRQGWWCPAQATSPATRSPPQRLAHPRNPRNPRNPRSLLCWSRVGHPSWAPRPTPQPLAFVVGSAGPQSTQKDAEVGRAGLPLERATPRDTARLGSPPASLPR